MSFSFYKQGNSNTSRPHLLPCTCFSSMVGQYHPDSSIMSSSLCKGSMRSCVKPPVFRMMGWTAQVHVNKTSYSISGISKFSCYLLEPGQKIKIKNRAMIISSGQPILLRSPSANESLKASSMNHHHPCQDNLL